MKIAIHQPNYFPYMGFFYKASLCDALVILDDCQYSKGSYTNRVEIRLGDRDKWLTIPVIHNTGQLIKDVKVANYTWKEWHYADVKRHCKVDISDVLRTDSIFLMDYTIASIKKYYHGNIIMASSLEIETNGTQRLVDICKALDADTYVSGIGGKKYIDEELFGDIKIEYIDKTFNKYSILCKDVI